MIITFLSLWDVFKALIPRKKILSLWGLLLVVDKMGLLELIVYGDSKTIIDWVNDVALLEVLALDHWCNIIKYLVIGFFIFRCEHTYREHN